MTENDINFVSSVLAEILRGADMYQRYVEKKDYYDKEYGKENGDYNYWKEIGIFCDSYDLLEEANDLDYLKAHRS